MLNHMDLGIGIPCSTSEVSSTNNDERSEISMLSQMTLRTRKCRNFAAVASHENASEPALSASHHEETA